MRVLLSDVHSFFKNLQNTIHESENKNQVSYINKDQDQADNEFCYDRLKEHPNVTRAEIVKEFKYYK